MSGVTQIPSHNPLILAAGGFAYIICPISIISIICLIAMFVLFATPHKELGYLFGMLNDICVALHYLLTIPIALAFYRILYPYIPPMIRFATIVGIFSMLVTIGLQLALIFEVLTFQQQGVWVSLSILLGVGFWLLITSLVAQKTGKFHHSVIMHAIAVPYLGTPVWALWLGRILFGW
jgi:hypothetical protein